MARPLRSNPITGPSSLLPGGPPLCLASGLGPSRSLPLGAFPGRAGRRSGDHEPISRETTGSHVPHKSLTRARATSMPDTAWAVGRCPPGSSQAPQNDLVSMSSDEFRHVCGGSLSLAFIGSYLTCSTARLFPQRSARTALDRRTLRWFVASSCKATTEGLPPSPMQRRVRSAPSPSCGAWAWPSSCCVHGALCAFTFRVSSWVLGNGSANRILKTQEDVPGRFPQVLTAESGLTGQGREYEIERLKRQPSSRYGARHRTSA